jgi:drug/metabolite transporter (DMT)-like permease
MCSVATLLFGSVWWIGRRRERRRSSERREGGAAQDRPVRMWSDGKTFLWGAVIGIVNITGMVLIFFAFSLGVTGLVTAVVSMHVVLILLYARFIVREPFRRTEMGGIALALGGMAVLHLFG